MLQREGGRIPRDPSYPIVLAGRVLNQKNFAGCDFLLCFDGASRAKHGKQCPTSSSSLHLSPPSRQKLIFSQKGQAILLCGQGLPQNVAQHDDVHGRGVAARRPIWPLSKLKGFYLHPLNSAFLPLPLSNSDGIYFSSLNPA